MTITELAGEVSTKLKQGCRNHSPQ